MCGKGTQEGKGGDATGLAYAETTREEGRTLVLAKTELHKNAQPPQTGILQISLGGR